MLKVQWEYDSFSMGWNWLAGIFDKSEEICLWKYALFYF